MPLSIDSPQDSIKSYQIHLEVSQTHLLPRYTVPASYGEVWQEY